MTSPVIDPTDPSDAAATVAGILAQNSPFDTTPQVYRSNIHGDLLQDLTSSVVKTTDCQVQYESTQPVPEHLTLSSTAALVWGSDIVAVFQMLRNADYNAGRGLPVDAWHRFRIGQYVMTTPGYPDLDVADYRQITGYGLNYLLQNSIPDAMAWVAGTTALAVVTAVFQAAGILAVGDTLSSICDYPGDWPAKTLANPLTYTFDGGAAQFLTIVNDALKASGCRPIYAQPAGRWMIEYLPDPTTQSDRWAPWYGSGGAGITVEQLDSRVVHSHNTAYTGDVYAVPNQWVYTVGGSYGTPVEGTGQVTLNNVSTGPSSQSAVGRIVRVIRSVQATSQADLVAQARAEVNAELSSIERITLQTAPWPVAHHFDVFTFYHSALPGNPYRKVQAQKWTLPLFGEPMSWETNVTVKLP